jgi:hypothetical protein
LQPPAPAESAGGFRYRAGRFMPLARVPGAWPSQIHDAISDRGEIAGSFVDLRRTGRQRVGHVVRSYLRHRDGTVTAVDVPGAGETSLYAIVDRGHVVGAYTDPGVTAGTDGRYPAGTLHAYVRDRHGVTTLDVPARS